jgi:PAS domain S-box-containing protein
VSDIRYRDSAGEANPSVGFPKEEGFLRTDPGDTQKQIRQLNESDFNLKNDAILAVDDDTLSLGLLNDLLSMNGYRVFTAENGDEAMDIFLEKRPDVVITDIMMPLTNGLEVLSRVREIDETVPVVLVTGYGDLDNAVGALRRGAHDFLVKPINAEMLLNTVSKAMELGRLKKLERNYTRILEQQVEERTRELAKTNDFLAGILESSRGVSIVLADLEGKIIFWNSGAENLYGYKAEEIMGCAIQMLYPEQRYAEEIFDNIARMDKNGTTVFQQNARQVSKDGRNLTVFMTMSYMLDGAGQVRGILNLGKDVTEQVLLNEELLESYRRITKIQNGFIFALAKLAESRDEETALHLKRIQAYCQILCRNLAQRESYEKLMTENFIENLVQGAILHDIGKVGLPDAILFTIEKFTTEEFEMMKLHTIKGGEALLEAAEESGEKEGYLTIGKDVAYYHHEQWDGSGYPFGLKGQQIPLVARIVAVADVYDALTTARRYKRAFTHEEACQDIILGKGKQFDPELIEVFIEVKDKFKTIRDSFSMEDSGEDCPKP